MSVQAVLSLPVADFSGHMDGDGGWWVLMALGMILFWGLVITGIVWLVRELGSHRHSAAAPNPLAVLDHRLADGTITPEEYRQRRAILTGKEPGEG